MQLHIWWKTFGFFCSQPDTIITRASALAKTWAILNNFKIIQKYTFDTGQNPNINVFQNIWPSESVLKTFAQNTIQYEVDSN